MIRPWLSLLVACGVPNELRFVGVLILVLSFAAGCGVPGAPMPPSLELARPVNDLAAVRQGGRVTLSWTAPTETTDRQNVRRPGPTVVCRAIDEYPLRSCNQVVARVRPEDLHSAPAAGGRESRVMFEDALPSGPELFTRSATYAIEVQNRSGKSAGFSNQVRVPLAPAVPPVQDLRVQATPLAALVTWTEPAIPPSVPNVSYWVRVMRSPADASGSYTMVRDLPFHGGRQSVQDRSFEWEHTYNYKVTGVTRVQTSAGEPVEFTGEEAVVARVLLHDVFPPETPVRVQAVFSGVGQKPFIDLTWTPDTEPDLAGYNVFRSEAGGTETQLNQEPVKAPAYRDEQVQPGHRYTYTINAVDVRGNQSAHSEPASESVPAR